MNALANRKATEMRTFGHIPLRFLHSVGANFTLPIQKKSISTTLFPFSLKKISLRPERHGNEKLQIR